MRPSIWIGSFGSADEWARASAQRTLLDPVFDHIDDALLHPRRVQTLHAWCAACATVRPLQFHWHFGDHDPDGSVHPAWTETGACTGCGLNSRMRAVVDFLQRSHTTDDSRCFLAEQVTPFATLMAQRFRHLVTAEYLGPHHAPGSVHTTGRPEAGGREIRHEDITRLSLDSDSLDLVLTQDVFEHIPDFVAAFRQCHRVLRPGGRMVFTVPFFPQQLHTEVRATVGTDGSITHLLEPEVHGNPVGDGSLCFQHFGWDLLDHLRQAGFERATAHTYWGPWQGHVGGPSFVFEAQR